MEIGTAVLLSSVLSGAGQFVATRAQAKAGQRTADIMAKQHKTNADLAKLQALQQENDRRKDFEMIEAWNTAQVDYDPWSSPSFLATKEENVATLQRDVENIQLMGKIQQNRSLQTAQAYEIEGANFRTMGQMAWLKPVGTMTEGFYKYKKLEKA